MSITVNGATNTITGAAGLAIAANTAVTGTLSASGLISTSAGSNGIYLNGTPSNTLATGNAVRFGTNFVIQESASPNTLDFRSYNGASWDTRGYFTAAGGFNLTNGLAVTGTLSASGNATVGGGTGVRTATVSSTNNNASFIASAGNGATGGYRFNNSSGTLHWNIYETFGAAGQQGSLGIYDEVGGGNVALFSSTGLAVTGTLSATGATTLGTAASTTTGLSVIDTLDASSTTAASLKTAGGLAVVKKTYCGDNIVMASGKGIDFSATANGSGTTTSEVLDDYEVGTWTPTQGAGLTVSGAFSTLGAAYTKIGRQVTATATLVGATNIAAAANAIMCAGLPFTVGTTGIGIAVNGANAASAAVISSTTSVYAGGAITTTSSISFTVTYFV